ncbi:hypothetical protein V3M44_03980 [Trueperella pyogenes]|uniref:hypothetical protein n=1 Tax=Trueperella pyogenes TaxID=1661 RepID=UPI00345D629E
MTLTLIRPSDEDASFPPAAATLGVVTSGAACAVWIRGNIPTTSARHNVIKAIVDSQRKVAAFELAIVCTSQQERPTTRVSPQNA